MPDTDVTPPFPPDPPDDESRPPAPREEVKGRWTFELAGGGSRASKDRLCPVCGGDSNCTFAAEGAVLCRRILNLPDGFKRGASLDSRVGWAAGVKYMMDRKSKDDGRMWVPVGEDGKPVRAPMISAELAAAIEAKEAAKKEAKRQFAFESYLRGACGGSYGGALNTDHPMVVEYLKGRGIDPAMLPGGKLPACLRFFEQCPDWIRWNERDDGRDEVRDFTTWPAMVTSVLNASRKPMFRGMHATYLVKETDGRVRKRSEDKEGKGKIDRRWHASCDGVVALLPAEGGGGSGGGGGAFPGGVLQIAEGLESGLSCVAATRYQTWACLSTNRFHLLVEMIRPFADPADGSEPAVHTIVFGQDLDKLVSKRGLPSKAGQTKTPKVAQEIRDAFPWLSVYTRPPCVEVDGIPVAPELVEVVEGELRPIDPSGEGRVGVDWNDVIRLPAPEGANVAGADRVAVGLLGGIDIDANAERMRERWARRDDLLAVGRAAGGNGGSSSAPAKADGADGGGGENPSKGAGGGKGGKGGGPPPGDGKFVGRDDWDLIPDNELGRARQYLFEVCAPDKTERMSRVGTCWRKVYVDEAWHRWDTVQGVWVQIPGKTEVGPIRGSVRRWMTPKREWVSDGDGGGKRVVVNSSLRQVEAVAKAVRDEVQIESPEHRFWIRPTFDRDGEPMFDRQAHERWVQNPGKEKLPEPRRLIALQNCLLDTEAVEAGELDVRPPTPLLFNSNVLPYGLDIAKVRDHLKHGGADGLDELAEELCPDVPKFFASLFAAQDTSDRGLAEATAQTREMQKLLWYYMTNSIGCKEANISVWHGPGNAGKGTSADFFMAVAGPGNYVASSMDDISDKNHVTSWKGKRFAVIDETDAGDRSDLSRGKAFLKRVSGGARVSLRELYKLEQPDVQLFTKVLILANEMPDFRDRSGQMLNRVIAFDFRVGHTGKDTYDPTLKERLVKQAAGGFVWALAGGVRLGERKQKGLKGFVQPAASAGLLAMFSEYMSDLPGFVDEWLEITNNTDDVLAVMDIHRCLVAHRTLNKSWKPDRDDPGQVSRAIYSVLRDKGWRLDREPNKRMRDADTGAQRQGAAFIGIKLSKAGADNKASVDAAEMKRNQYGASAGDANVFNPPV